MRRAHHPGPAALLLVLAVALAFPAAAEETADDPPQGDAPPVSEEVSPELAAPTFPDPLLMRRARTYRAVGATLSLLGAASMVISFNVALAVVRSGDEDRLNSMEAWAVPLGVMSGVGLMLGGPLWSMGGEMHRQLTRNTKGDEKLRREVANDARYWQGRTMNAFGTTMALTGGLSVAVGSLLLVGGIWAVERVSELGDAGLTVSPNYIGIPVLVVGAGAALLVTGLQLRKDGLERSRRVREAYATTLLMPVPYLDPISRGGGLLLVGRF